MSSDQILTSGLQNTFSDSANIEKISRDGFKIFSSHYQNDDATYTDQWVAGGGQELAMDRSGQAMTRTYVGNVIDHKKLEALGISEKQVIELLKDVITDHGSKIRFDKDFAIDLEPWQYSYTVTYKREDPYIINGIEEIFYKGQSVFVHTFGISKVTEG